LSGECPRNLFGGRSRGDPLRFDLVVRGRPSKAHWFAYDVLLDGEVIISNSRDPEPDLARALAGRGYNGFVDVIDARTGQPRARVSIENAARIETIEGPSGPFWRRQQTPTDRACAAEMQLGAKGVAASLLSRPGGLSVE